MTTHQRPRSVWTRLATALAAVFALAIGLVCCVAALALQALTPQPGEWSHRVRIGPIERDLSVPVMLRWATHPLAAPWINGRTLDTRAGRWHLQATADGRMQATCRPCTVHWPALASLPVSIDAAVLKADRRGVDHWSGTLVLGAASPPVVLTWHARWDRQALRVQAQLPARPLAPIIALFGDAVREARQASITGTLALKLVLRVDGAGVHAESIDPQLADVSVTGLGTEALLGAAPPARCGRTAARIDGWLPRAVVAAEDQRFFEHGGFDLDEMKAAWSANDTAALRPQARRPRGASTITQQLAKLVYTGDERNAARKVREWLYAVEMERTLGKGRILQWYLTLAPWGDGVCGAEAAARRYLGKSARKLAPHEAAWLASLLTRPDAQLARWRARGEIDFVRTAWVIDGLRPLPKTQREEQVEKLLAWQPSAHVPGRDAGAPPPAAVAHNVRAEDAPMR